MKGCSLVYGLAVYVCAGMVIYWAAFVLNSEPCIYGAVQFRRLVVERKRGEQHTNLSQKCLVTAAVEGLTGMIAGIRDSMYFVRYMFRVRTYR